tara:strand:+ start:785 stop:1510 length:726 start_codon:yes stop_codon:yes gene_type:complete
MNIEKNNRLIKDLNEEINYLLENHIEPSDEFKYLLKEYDHPLVWLMKQGIKHSNKKRGGFIDNISKEIENFDLSAEIQKSLAKDAEMTDDPNAVSSAYERAMKKLKDDEAEFNQKLDSQKDDIDVSDDGLVALPTKKLPYSHIKVRFIGHPNTISVTPGKGKKIETNLSDRMNFDILTIKESRLGLIFHLTSPQLPSGTSVLLYVKDLDNSPQENFTQLTYDKGRYVGDKKSVSFEIRELK